MAIVFTEQKKREKILMIILVLFLLITLFNIWRIFFWKKEGIIISQPVTPEYKYREVKMNLSVLENPLLEVLTIDYLEPLEEPGDFSAVFGKDNPFEKTLK